MTFDLRDLYVKANELLGSVDKKIKDISQVAHNVKTGVHDIEPRLNIEAILTTASIHYKLGDLKTYQSLRRRAIKISYNMENSRMRKHADELLKQYTSKGPVNP